MMQWIGLFHPFTSDSMESVRIPRELGTRIAAFLQELTEPRAAEVLLNYITCIARTHQCRYGRLVEVCRWDGKWERILSGSRTWHVSGDRTGFEGRRLISVDMFLCPNDAPVLVEYFCPVFAVSSCWFGFGLHVTSFVLFGSFLLVGYLY